VCALWPRLEVRARWLSSSDSTGRAFAFARGAVGAPSATLCVPVQKDEPAVEPRASVGLDLLRKTLLRKGLWTNFGVAPRVE
jgi:hypothetical protein